MVVSSRLMVDSSQAACQVGFTCYAPIVSNLVKRTLNLIMVAAAVAAAGACLTLRVRAIYIA